MTQHKDNNIEPQPTPTEWDMPEDMVTAVKDIQNNKGVKYCRELLDDYNKKDYRFSIDEDKLSSSYFDPKYIKHLVKLMKATKADNVNLKVGDGLPLIATFVKNGEPQGSYMIAPKWRL
jgi:hypothetical protein